MFGVKKLYGFDGKPWDGEDDFPQYIPRNKPWRTHSIDATILPWFSRDMGPAWEIVKAMSAEMSFVLRDTNAATFICEFGNFWAEADTGALAVCRAALAARERRPSPGGTRTDR